mmetsp:Transcript_6361/g.10546  ORF Transcript_6361/g.10546 Transcript_6361/m.10546 type:complete len:97 (-) Transcript_6361:27-317(-)
MLSMVKEPATEQRQCLGIDPWRKVQTNMPATVVKTQETSSPTGLLRRFMHLLVAAHRCRWDGASSVSVCCDECNCGSLHAVAGSRFVIGTYMSIYR